ncbi:MAG: Serine 3-dehydrogenase [Chlamydiae bacterium]|nr:Serine 3-dehydrogenase [Chlamydiota bacterium]
MPSKPSFNLALVTGSTSGLGKAMADFLEEKGIQVIRTGSKQVNLADPSMRKKLLEEITEKKPDLIINNAGLGFYGLSVDLPIADQLTVVEVNCNALLEISLHAAKTLLKAGKGGTILNISSAGAFFAFPTFNAYCASKAFVNHFSLALDLELKEKGIRVLCACPGQIATNFRTRAAKGFPQKTDKRTISIEKAVQYLWKQIQKQKPLYIFDWKTRLMVWLTRLFPRALLNKALLKSLKDRYK